jgi:uncharacterized membrane protein
MFDFSSLLNGYQSILHFVAEIAVHSLELIGICIIIFGSVRTLVQIFSKKAKKKHINITIELGRTLSLALEFKMGAEIVNTVIIHDLEELAILAIVIALRAVLAILIHWAIRNEKKAEDMFKENENK